MKALVFGANGQDGAYLVEALQARGIEALGFSRSGPWARVDVANGAEVDATVALHRPDFVFQLAARSTTRHDALFENHATISTGALNVLEAVATHAPSARVFLAGSGLQFENRGQPIDEDTPFAATSAYAVARIQSVYAARYYRARGLRAYVGYLFHHESPRRGPGHLSREIAEAARRIAGGDRTPFEIGDPTVVKEWTFAGDVVAGILALVTQDAVAEAVIGSGEGHAVTEWLDACFSHVGLAWRDHVRQKPGFRAEYPVLVSNPARLRALGWQPRVGLEELAAMMMD
ncbi:MAG TPA: GDP-mannose 4,6-dehydratase [Polyangia bacterium]|nr:GDP-mannose 4,6-dehydratase [Polyangia bacterium]